MDKIITRLNSFISRQRCFCLIIIAKLATSFLKKKYWLVLERGNDAQDNAWHFFKYLLDEQKNVKVRYAIRKTSNDFSTNLKDYHNLCIEYDSFRYYITLYRSKVIVSTHVQTYIPRYEVYNRVKEGFWDVPCKKVFLQHGISHNELSCFEYPKFKIDLFICGAYNELELLSKNLHQPDGVLSYTGFARFDNLFQFSKKKQILIMPTWWRMYYGFSKEKFIGTDFFRAYSSVLSDTRILAKLIEKDYHLIFYNHFEFQKYNELFEPYCSERVHLIKLGEVTVQDLLKQSSLLITDYSSVYYDFLYMKKQIIFFHLKENEFRKHQYGKEYDDVAEFGIVVKTVDELVEEILACLDNDCQINPKYGNKHAMIFKYYDNQNCERIYTEIKKIL